MQNNTTEATLKQPAWPLFLTVPAALGLYWLTHTALDLEPQAVLNGVVISASVLGTICSLDWAFRGEA
jgi:hypothetical protein